MDDATASFLDTFFQLEQTLRQLCGGREEGFFQLLNRARQKSSVIRRYERELRAFNELRNMLVHAPLPMELARPAPAATALLRAIHRELTEPETVVPRFARRVVRLAVDATVQDALAAMRETGFSQFPVYHERRFVGLLTDSQLARWFARHLGGPDGGDGGPSRAGPEAVLAVPLAEVLRQVEANAVAFVPRRATVLDVREMFEEHLRRGRLHLDAVIVTESGASDEEPLGIVTPKDAVALAAAPERGGE